MPGRVTRSLGMGLSLVVLMMCTAPSVIHAAGLNTDVALSPPEDGFIIRTQWRYSQLSDDPTPMDRQVNLLVIPTTIVYGITADLTILGTVPVIYRHTDFGSGGGAETDAGVGDIPLLLKYRFYQEDEPGVTTRWSVIGGLELPTFDDDFSSDSVDPIIGTVWTHQELDWWVDWDLIYKFNTAGGIRGDDELRGDVAVSLRLAGGEGDDRGPWGLYAIGEINAKYIVDGSSQVFLSPGIQFITPQLILEVGAQLPVHQDMKSPRLETDFTVVGSIRFQF